MNRDKLVFSHVTQHVPLTTFRRSVARYGGEHKVKSFPWLEQFLCMVFAQLTYRESVRDIDACLPAQAGTLYHMGIKSRVSRSTLANANEVRDWRLYAKFAQSLIGIVRRLFAVEPFGVDLKDTVYALNASTIDLCLSVFSWAPFRSTKVAIKLPTLLDLRGNIPTFLHISDGNCTMSMSSPVAARAGCLLRHGPRLSRLRTAPSPARRGQLLCDSRQIQPPSPASVFASGRPEHGVDV